MSVRNSDPQSSDSPAQSSNLAAKLRARIVALARAAGQDGISISETEQQIPEHKTQSVSPRFAELVNRRALVRVLIGHGKPTTRFSGGVPLYVTRLDTETRRNVIVHWLPEFAPSAPKEDAAKAA
jgi:hypothetical protein